MRQLFPSGSRHGGAQVGNIFTIISNTYDSPSRSICLTKFYCSTACFKADEAAHSVCCKSLLEVDERKKKKGGKARVEGVNQMVESFQNNLAIATKPSQAIANEAVSRIRKVKVKGHTQEENVSEVD